MTNSKFKIRYLKNVRTCSNTTNTDILETTRLIPVGIKTNIDDRTFQDLNIVVFI